MAEAKIKKGDLVRHVTTYPTDGLIVEPFSVTREFVVGKVGEGVLFPAGSEDVISFPTSGSDGVMVEVTKIGYRAGQVAVIRPPSGGEVFATYAPGTGVLPDHWKVANQGDGQAWTNGDDITVLALYEEVKR